MTWYDFSEITSTAPEKSLTRVLPYKAGRNNSWRITIRFRGGRHKRRYRLVDFRGYDKAWVPAKVLSVEYDPFRTARIVLVVFADGEKRYMLARQGVKVGHEMMIGSDAPIEKGNRKQLKDIPEWLQVYNLEVTPQTKGKLIKSAWNYATLMGKDESAKVIFVKLPSGEVRKFNENCRATIGVVSNDQHKHIVIGKAGRQRRKGKKPHVLGKSMNPVDHPHGWWEAHTSIGLKWPKSFVWKNVSPWIKTRKKKKRSDKFIVSRRTKN